jgi:hypothetical protein
MQSKLKFNDHNEMESFKNPLKQAKVVDHTERDNKYLNNLRDPCLRETQKDKWVDSKDYMVLGKSTYEMI